jgi:hypothetical protein
MRQATIGKKKARSLAAKSTGLRAYRWALIITVSIGTALIAVALRAYSHRAMAADRETRKESRLLPQANPLAAGRFYSRLSHQPEADGVRRSLGQRFLGPGRERTILTGTLTVGTDQSPVQLVRTQTDDGERVEIVVGSGGFKMVWTPSDGALVGGRRATGNARAILERLALDSPDEFVLAQLRGASYYTVARGAMPKSAGGSESYTGPIWDIVRVGEPEAKGEDATLSRFRSFHIDTSTGLIARSFSQEQGETIVAEFSQWVDRSGEKIPTQIIWSKDGQTIMKFGVLSVGLGPKP